MVSKLVQDLGLVQGPSGSRSGDIDMAINIFINRLRDPSLDLFIEL